MFIYINIILKVNIYLIKNKKNLFFKIVYIFPKCYLSNLKIFICYLFYYINNIVKNYISYKKYFYIYLQKTTDQSLQVQDESI
ncbi:hypothetical protein VAMP_2n87 [Candidatus Vampirococcus lugosii]|uniref:Transmembrane protein n=1 Tax=Candidatus Vampirococcus lugosii TaxID=2789015 RepID=A0ABS5QK04_9BACT|nr:hypothetical protein [Candidatus Vampirococcus lugosii]